MKLDKTGHYGWFPQVILSQKQGLPQSARSEKSHHEDAQRKFCRWEFCHEWDLQLHRGHWAPRATSEDPLREPAAADSDWGESDRPVQYPPLLPAVHQFDQNLHKVLPEGINKTVFSTHRKYLMNSHHDLRKGFLWTHQTVKGRSFFVLLLNISLCI